MSWCREARERGKLTGDLCYAQSIALVIAIKLEEDTERTKMHSMEDFWLFYTNRKAFDAKQERKRNKQEAKDALIVEADDLASLIKELERQGLV